MIRLIIILLLTTMSPALAVQLLPAPVVTDEVIRLSDLFTDTGDKGSKVIGRSPAPGVSITLSAEQLLRLAQANQLDWRPESASTKMVLSRASQLIEAEAMQAEVERALQEQMPQTLLTVQFDRSVAGVHLPATAPTSLRVSSLSRNEDSARFTARLLLAEGTEFEKVLTISGRYTRMVEIPVPVSRLPQEHIISERDLTWRRVPYNTVSRGTIESLKQLIGMEVRRSLPENNPIRAADITEPQLINKGDIVVMEVVTPFMSLTTQGRALDNGRLHDMIRILNTSSRQVVQGTVIGRGRVQVGAALLAPVQQSALTLDSTVRSR